MTTELLTIDASEKVKKALELMSEKNTGSIIVMEKNAPVGIMTERDIARGLLAYKDIVNFPVHRIMSTPLITAQSDLDVRKAVEVMVNKKIRRLPLVRDNKLVGILTSRDIFRWVTSPDFYFEDKS